MPDWMMQFPVGGLAFVWPSLLWLLLILPLAVGVYLFVRRYERATTGSVITGALVILGLLSLLLAIARPKVELNLPTRADELMVVLDISGSMSADDVDPNRFEVAKATLKDMIATQPPSTRLGLVTAAATATLIQPSTTEREQLFGALDTVNLQTGSAIGSGLLIGLSELLPAAGIDVQALMNDSIRGSDPDAPPSWEPSPNVEKPAGSNRSKAMVLISDGGSNVGPDVLQMAELAAKLGIRINTIGIGTREGAVVKAEGVSQRVSLEQTVLADVADITLGKYYEGASAQDLTEIFEAIEASLSFDNRRSLEVSSLVMLLGILLLLVGMASKLARQGRLV
jgi:Ca-activated chloride channel family protein